MTIMAMQHMKKKKKNEGIYSILVKGQQLSIYMIGALLITNYIKEANGHPQFPIPMP
jgi:hypothetical protein